MMTQDHTAEQLNDLLDEPLPPPELARMRGPAAAEARAALAVRQALKDLQPDGAFVAQLDTRLLAITPGQNAAMWRETPFGLAWLRRAVPGLTDLQTTPFGLRPSTLAISGIAALLALVCAAAILLSLLGRSKPPVHALGGPVLLEPSPLITNTGLSSYVLSDTLAVLPAAPSRVPLFRYTPQGWDAGTTRQVANLARSLGLRDPFTVTLDETAHYTVTDGARYVNQYRDMITYFDSSMRGPGSGSGQAGARPSFSETEPLAEAFLKAAGFLSFPFRAEQGDPSLPGEVHFVRLADGRPVQNGDAPFDAQVDVVAGRILYAGFVSRTLESAGAGTAAIIGADEAWQMLQQNRLLAFSRFAVATPPVSQTVSTPQAQPAPTVAAPAVDAEGNVNGVEGRLSAIIRERIYTGTVVSTRRIDATLSEWQPGLSLAGGWIVTLTGTQLSDLAQYDGLRMKVWGHYDAASRSIEVQRYVKGDSSEHRQAWLGTITNTVAEDGVTRSFFTTKAGQRFIVSVALPCDSLQTVCVLNVLNAPTDRVIIILGAIGQETYRDVPVLAFLGLGGGMRDMTESDLANVLPRPRTELQILGGPLTTGGPAPTPLAPYTPSVQPEQSLEGVEGNLVATLIQDAQGQIVDVNAELSVLPLNGANTWVARLTGPLALMRDLAQFDGLRVLVWGRYDPASQRVNVDRFGKADPSEHIQAWLGVVTNTVMDDGVMRSFFVTQEGQRFILARSLQCMAGQTICLINAPTDRVIIIEGAVGQDAYRGVTVLYDLGIQSGDRNMSQRDLANVAPRPYIDRQTTRVSPATAAPAPTSVAPVGSGIVEEMELIYYSQAPLGSITGTVTLRPAWRFRGHSSDGQGFEALVDAVRPNTAHVTLDAFSGRPNPSWPLDSAATSELQVLLATAAQTATRPPGALDGALGYRGILVDLTDATTGATQHFRVFDEVVMGQGAQAVWADPQRRLERWLLRSGSGWFDNDLYAQLSQQIDSALPPAWEDVAAVTD